MMLVLNVPGEPVAKARPRFRQFKGRVLTYTPKETHAAEKAIADAYSVKCGTDVLFHGQPIGIDCRFYMKIPKSISAKKRKEMDENREYHTKKPDLDNLIKTVCDALNGVAFDDDSSIVMLRGSKVYSAEPHTEVVLWTNP